MPRVKKSRSFKDISLSFSKHPVTNDIIALKNEDAIFNVSNIQFEIDAFACLQNACVMRFDSASTVAAR